LQPGWRVVHPKNALTIGTSERWVSRLLAEGLPLPTAQQEHVTTLYEHWQIPMYNLDFALIPVSMDELMAAQERELWSTV
jgi:hypothetical protein